MVPTHKTTVVFSNVCALVSLQRATETTAACAQHPSPVTVFVSTLARWRDEADQDTSCARERTELNQLSSRWPGGGGIPPTLILDHISGSYLFCGPGGEGVGGGGCVEARLLHISCCRSPRRWSRCTEAVGPARIHASAGHHESTESEVCSSGSTSGAICVRRAGLQN